MSRGRILFIDDESELCRAAEEWLSVSGFVITSFTAPDLAIAQKLAATRPVSKRSLSRP